MNENSERVQQFKEEVAGMGISTPEAERERWALIGGIGLMVGGLVAVIGGWWGAAGTDSAAEAVSFLLSGGVLGLGLILIGGFLFLRYSMSRYLRYWLIRMIYEDQSNTDRVIASTEELERAIQSLRVPKKPSVG